MTMKQTQVWVLQHLKSDAIIGVYSTEGQARRTMMRLGILKQVVEQDSTGFSKPGGVVFRFEASGFRLTKAWYEEEMTPLVPQSEGSKILDEEIDRAERDQLDAEDAGEPSEETRLHFRGGW